MTDFIHSLDGENDIELSNNEKRMFEMSLYTGSRCAWSVAGAMCMLFYMNENLYLENNLYPHAAQIVFIVALILACLFDAFINFINKENKKADL